MQPDGAGGAGLGLAPWLIPSVSNLLQKRSRGSGCVSSWQQQENPQWGLGLLTCGDTRLGQGGRIWGQKAWRPKTPLRTWAFPSVNSQLKQMSVKERCRGLQASPISVPLTPWGPTVLTFRGKTKVKSRDLTCSEACCPRSRQGLPRSKPRPPCQVNKAPHALGAPEQHPSSLLLPHQCKLSPPKTCSFLGPPHPTTNSRAHKTLLGSSSPSPPSTPIQAPHNPSAPSPPSSQSVLRKTNSVNTALLQPPSTPTEFRTKPRQRQSHGLRPQVAALPIPAPAPHTEVASLLKGITLILATGPLCMLPLPESSTLSCCFSLKSPPLLTPTAGSCHSYCHNVSLPSALTTLQHGFTQESANIFRKGPDSEYFPHCRL